MAYDEALAERVRRALGSEDAVAERRMFGGLAFLLEGHMAVSVSGQGGIMLHVDPAEGDRLIAEGMAAPTVMRGRPMSGWVRVAAEDLGDDAGLARWVAHGVAYAHSLPPKS